MVMSIWREARRVNRQSGRCVWLWTLGADRPECAGPSVGAEGGSTVAVAGAGGAREDRRVRRTRRVLREALLELVVAKGYDRVTVQDVLERADLSRATFYAHYRDKDDLLVGSLGELLDALRGAMAAFSGVAAPGQPGEAPGQDGARTRAVFEHVAGQRHLYRGLVGSRAWPLLHRRVREHFTALAEEHFREVIADRQSAPAVPVEVTAQYVGGALLGLLTWWLESDTPLPAEQLAPMFDRLVAPSVQAALGLSP